MKKDKPDSDKFEDLRRKAEKLLSKKGIKGKQILSHADALEIVHELQVHQIELEMQNEELRRTQQEAEESRNKYTDLYDFAPIGYFTFDKDGTVMDSNLAGAAILGVEKCGMVNRRFQIYVAHDSLNIFNTFCKRVFETDTRQTCEIKLMKNMAQIIYAQIEGIKVESKQGKGNQCLAAMIDISERKLEEERNSLLHSIAMSVSETDSLRSVVETILRKVCEFTGWVYAEAWLPSDTGNRLEFCHAWYSRHIQLEEFCGKSKDYTFAPEIGLPGRAWAMKQPVWVRDVTLDQAYMRKGIAARAGIKAGVAFPLFADNKVAAVIVAYMFESLEEDKRLVNVISSMSSHLGCGIRRKQAEELLRQSEEKFRQLAENIQEVFWITSADGREIIYVSPAYEKIWGRTVESLYKNATDWINAVYPVDRERVSIAFLEQTKHGDFNEEYRIVRPDGSISWIHDRSFPIKDESGNIYRIAGIAADVTKYKEMEGQLRKLSCAVEQSPSTVIITDTEGNIQYVNPKFAQLTGYTMKEVLGKNPRILKSGKTADEEYKKLWGAITSGSEWSGVLINRKKNGELYWEHTTIAPLRNTEGVIANYIAVKEDVTERNRLDETIRQMAYHDYLTALPNRIQFKDRSIPALAYAKRNNEALSIMFMDIDKFKIINDAFGHSAGDQLLQEIANRLKSSVRESDTVARFAGDEFDVLLPEIGYAENAAIIAGKIIENIKQPVKIGGNKITITASIGIAMFPKDGMDIEILLKHADIAMYNAKEKGGNNFQFYGQ